MDASCVANGEKRACKREEDRGSWPSTHVHVQHKRSKSASGKNSDLSRGASCSIQESNILPELQSSARNIGIQGPLNGRPSNTSIDAASRHRDSLEKDIEQLQMQLQQEKSMRILLERAMGRASSTLSPGHMHFSAQTKELITEIELLEEEVTNREQHVLSLYRSIFEHSVSRPSSKQSSGKGSPAHATNASKKHPSVISSSFCSSKSFPLRPFQTLATINGSMKRKMFHSMSRHASVLSRESNIHFEQNCQGQDKQQLPASDKAYVLRTLKDHLQQCPNKLSEELVRCMAAIYCWLRHSVSTTAEQHKSPLLSRSSTNVIIPKRGIGEDRDWSCKSMVEIYWISTDKNNFSRASYALNNYRVLVEQLEKVDLSQMGANARTAFWINIYNSLVMHAYLAYGIPHSSLRRIALFCKASYNIGGYIINATVIEQSIFCLSTPRIGRWLETLLSTALRKRSGEERMRINSKFGLQIPQPLVCFALCTGAISDPVLKVYTAANIKEELELAKKEFLQTNIIVKKSRKVFLPKLVERYVKEASISSDDLLQWVAENVDKKLHDSIHKCLNIRSTNRKTSQIMEWLPYISRFRYVFSKDLTEKPWWV